MLFSLVEDVIKNLEVESPLVVGAVQDEDADVVKAEVVAKTGI
jgi:hypothetical protein